MISLCIFFFEPQSPFASVVWETTAKAFSCETPAAFCGQKNFAAPSIGMWVAR